MAPPLRILKSVGTEQIKWLVRRSGLVIADRLGGTAGQMRNFYFVDGGLYIMEMWIDCIVPDVFLILINLYTYIHSQKSYTHTYTKQCNRIQNPQRICPFISLSPQNYQP